MPEPKAAGERNLDIFQHEGNERLGDEVSKLEFSDSP